jgi:Porin PorA
VKRKVFGFVLLGLGAFLLVAGIIATVWAPGVVKKTPLDVEQFTSLDGVVKKIDVESGELVENPVKVQSITKTDSEASDDDTVVWVQTSCVVIDVDDAPDCVDGDDPRLVSATTDVFASDRVTAEAVGDFEGLPPDAVPHVGLVNKWPFDSEKKNYEYWDGTTGQAWPAVYEGTDSLLGVDVYVYTITIADAEIEIAEGTPGTYDNVIEIWVEPKTGAIQQQTQDQQRYLADGTQVLDLQVGFTEDQQQTFADDAKENMRLLSLMTFWLPVIGFVGGGLCVVAGGALLLSARRNESSSQPERQLADA